MGFYLMRSIRSNNIYKIKNSQGEKTLQVYRKRCKLEKAEKILESQKRQNRKMIVQLYGGKLEKVQHWWEIEKKVGSRETTLHRFLKGYQLQGDRKGTGT